MKQTRAWNLSLSLSLTALHDYLRVHTDAAWTMHDSTHYGDYLQANLDQGHVRVRIYADTDHTIHIECAERDTTDAGAETFLHITQNILHVLEAIEHTQPQPTETWD